MPQLKMGSSIWTDIANAVSGLRKGKVEEEDRQREVSDRERLMQMREAGEKRADEASLRDSERLGLDRRRLDKDAAEHARVVGEQEGAELGLRERIKQLSPDAAGLDKMDYASLRAQLGMLEQRATMLKNTELAHRKQLDDQLRATRQLIAMANMNLANIKRARDDAIKRIQTDPALMKNYAELIKAKNPEPLRAMIAQISNGRDLDAEYLAAGQEVTKLKNQGMMLNGVTGGAGPTADVQREVDKNMPFALLDPTVQAQISAQVAARLKAGQPIDLQEARSRGIPVENIAQQVGVNVDPTTGAIVTAAAGAPPAATGQGMTLKPEVKNMLSTAAGAIGQIGTSPSAIAGMLTPAPSPETPQVSRLDVLRQRVGGGEIIPPRLEVAPTGAESALRSGFQSITAPSQAGPSVTSRTGISPAPGMAGMPLAQPNTQFSQAFMGLRSAMSMPQAEQLARQLLDAGHDYEQVIGNIPEGYKAMLSARLPKRLPTGGTQLY